MPADGEERIRTRLAEIMSSAGLGYNQIALEVLYLLPSEFVKAYTELWEKALGPAGGGDARGQQLSRDAHLGKAATSTKDKGIKVGAGAGGQAKKWKRMGFSVRDEQALNFKGRVDRRLRAIGREMQQFNDIGQSALRGSGKGGDGGRGQGTTRCSRCGRIMEETWVYCPKDGSKIETPK